MRSVAEYRNVETDSFFIGRLTFQIVIRSGTGYYRALSALVKAGSLTGTMTGDSSFSLLKREKRTNVRLQQAITKETDDGYKTILISSQSVTGSSL